MCDSVRYIEIKVELDKLQELGIRISVGPLGFVIQETGKYLSTLEELKAFRNGYLFHLKGE